jgi:hypothetical protein
MRSALVTVAFVGVAVAACAPDSTFSDIARDHVVKGGPAAACCSTYGGGVASPECAAEAEKKCAFARGATVKVGAVTRKGSNAATVALSLDGPNGNGVCTFEVSDFGAGRKRGLRIQGGTCERR